MSISSLRHWCKFFDCMGLAIIEVAFRSYIVQGKIDTS